MERDSAILWARSPEGTHRAVADAQTCRAVAAAMAASPLLTTKEMVG